MNLVKRMKNSPTTSLWRWTRLTSEKWEDAWVERLQFLGPGRAAFIGWPGSRSVRIEAFVDEKTSRRLVKEFGGKVTKARDWIANPDQPRKPLGIRGRITVHGDETTFAKASPTGKHAHILIPAGMAFGTGDHATTASCLRMLCDLESQLPEGWRAIDAGCGSGILAVAAAVLGASEVDAFDYDPASVRITKANVRANRAKGVRTAEADVLHWKPAGAVDVVMANLFSDLLMKAAPVLKRATKRQGWLLFSGVLRTQLAEVLETFQKLGFEVERTVIRGKWSAGRLRRTR
ncbi:MAG TPA: 50S ribosomal protein L11 methyltransferase [Chthoniobacterales bacterium]|nr:50S ribosomal protein L11 methyltransferase [Chthoniobacterales bacterium]